MKLPIVSWLNDPIEKSIRSVFDDTNIGTEALDLLKKYQRQHFRHIQAEFGDIKLLGMTAPIGLTQIYSQTYFSTTVHRRLYEEDWRNLADKDEHERRRKTRSEKDRVLGDSFIEDHQRVIILGGPGAGKTTFLKHLALAYTDKDLFGESKLKTSRFPFLIQLPALAKSALGIEQELAERLVKTTDKYARDFVSRLLKKGKAIVLFDSLDEVPTEYRKDVIAKVNDFITTYPEVRAVLSCRTADYEEVFANFHEVEVAKLSHAAGKRIIKAWFRDEPQKANNLIQNIVHNKDVEQLTETPLLLSLLCIQFNNDLKLPARRMELYKRCIDALLIKWDASRNFRRDTAYTQLTDDRKERIFEYIAGEAFEPKQQYVLHSDHIESLIGEYCKRFGIDPAEAKSVLKEIESHHGIIERHSADTYCFSHPSFQEYFAARRFIGTNRDTEVVSKHFKDENWASIIEFIIAMKEDPHKLIHVLIKNSSMTGIKQYPAMTSRTRLLRLLYRCLASGPSLDPGYLQNAVAHLYDSQTEIFRIYRESRTYPIARLIPDGVTHSYYTFNKRDTLSGALQQYRKLSNEIFNTPMPVYAKYVIEHAEAIEHDFGGFKDIFFLLSMIVPMSSQHPSEVDSILERCKNKLDPELGFMCQIIESTQAILGKLTE